MSIPATGRLHGASAAAEAYQLLLDRIAAAEAATAAGSGNSGLTDRYAARPDSSDLAGSIQGSQPPQSESGYSPSSSAGHKSRATVLARCKDKEVGA
jgi:hypothetical protein